MNLSDLGKTITKYGVPLLGGIVGGPAGLALGHVIAAQFGGSVETSEGIEQLSQKIQSDPEAPMKLAELQSKYELELVRLSNADLDSARKREMEVKDWMPAVLSLIVTIGFFSSIVAIMYIRQDADDKEVLFMMLGGLGSAFTSVIAYYFGSSAGSARKDKMFLGTSR